ncbi:MAG: hypothetical protein Q7J85_12365 [Bacillota bacterium]|nr:hypothetical protein [Bacillota bacterium]
MKNQIVEYNITDAAIAEMSSLYMGLKVMSLDDQEGFEAVHSGRMVIKGKRVEVEKKRKELKASALEWGKRVDSEAKRIFGLLAPIETHLQTEEDKITKERERIKAEEEQIAREITQKRVADLLAVNMVLPFFDVATMSDTEYAATYEAAKNKYMAEQLRIQEENEARAEAEAKLIIERAEIELIRQEQAEQTRIQAEKEKALQAERNAIEAEKRAEQERKDKESFEKEAAEKARIKAEADAKDKVIADALKEKEHEEVEAAEKVRLAELAPDKDKLLDYGRALMDVKPPELKNIKAKEILNSATGAVYQILKDIAKKAKGL